MVPFARIEVSGPQRKETAESKMLAQTLRSAAAVRRMATKNASVRGMAAVQRPFVAEEMENKYLVKTYNQDGVRGQPNMVITHGKGQYLYDSEGEHKDLSSDKQQCP